jgi:hypothetical protein
VRVIKCGPAAIDGQIDPGDLSRGVGGEEDAGIGHVPRGGHAAQRVVRGVARGRLVHR